LIVILNEALFCRVKDLGEPRDASQLALSKRSASKGFSDAIIACLARFLANFMLEGE
jgi:hypothetical protein